MLQIFMQVLKLEEHFEGLFVGMVFIELWVGGLLMLQRVAALKGCFATRPSCAKRHRQLIQNKIIKNLKRYLGDYHNPRKIGRGLMQ
jgi:hypothetical protein